MANEKNNLLLDSCLKSNVETGGFWSFDVDEISKWAYWDGAFSKEDCEKIIEIGNSKNIEHATVVGGGIDKVRQSKVSWLYPNDDVEWVYRRITDIVTNLNERFFRFDLFGITEGLQFTKYMAPFGKYGKHVDCIEQGVIRKLSLTLQLSDPEDYEGGELCMYFGEEPDVMEKKQGRVIVFPSYSMHEVTPVTKGTRYSLVCWITGKPFK